MGQRNLSRNCVMQCREQRNGGRCLQAPLHFPLLRTFPPPWPTSRITLCLKACKTLGPSGSKLKASKIDTWDNCALELLLALSWAVAGDGEGGVWYLEWLWQWICWLSKCSSAQLGSTWPSLCHKIYWLCRARRPWMSSYSCHKGCRYVCAMSLLSQLVLIIWRLC